MSTVAAGGRHILNIDFLLLLTMKKEKKEKKEKKLFLNKENWMNLAMKRASAGSVYLHANTISSVTQWTVSKL